MKKMRMSKSVKNVVFVASSIGIITLGSAVAYFTDADTATNTFTVGKVSLDLQEPDWNPDSGKNLTPGKELKKNPQILNDGVNDEFVFMEVRVPYRKIVTANADGTKNPAADTELFHYKVNDGWQKLSSSKDEAAQTINYIYVYGSADSCQALPKEEATPALFDTVTFVNLVEGQNLENVDLQILINAYGIQTTDIAGGSTSPETVWDTVKSQAPSVDVEVEEDANTDIKK